MTLYRAIERFFPGESPVCIEPTDVYEEDDPLVLKYPSKFVPIRIVRTGKGAEPTVIEQATAAPGERRNIRRP
jgi:hypothetical protein